MSQPYANWDVIEEQDYGIYRYIIFRVTDAEGRNYYRGWAERGSWNLSNWYQESDSLDTVRLNIIALGRQIP